MAITVKRLGTVRSDSDQDGYVSYTQKWRVKTDNREQGHTSIAQAVGVTLYDAFVTPGESNLYARAKSFGCTRVDEADGFHYEFTVGYDTRPYGVAQTNLNPLAPGGTGTIGPPSQPPQPPASQAPTARPWTLTWGTAKKERLQFRDQSFTPKPVLSTAGQLLTPGLRVEFPVTTLTVAGNVPTFDYSTIPEYVGTVNASDWHGFPARSCKCEELSATSQYEQGVYYYEFRLVVHIANKYNKAADGTPLWWDEELLNAGTKQKLNGKWVPCQIHGVDTTEPMPLNANGGMLDPPANPAEPTNYVWLRYRPFYPMDWANLI